MDIVVSSDRDLMGYNGHVKDTVAHLARTFSLAASSAADVPRRHEHERWLHLKHSIAHNLSPRLGHHSLQGSALRTEAEMAVFNSRVCVAPIHFAPKTDFWEVLVPAKAESDRAQTLPQVDGSKKLAANHAKVYIIDDTHFFVGSDNFYVSGVRPRQSLPLALTWRASADAARPAGVRLPGGG